jgi:hypothetical protein
MRKNNKNKLPNIKLLSLSALAILVLAILILELTNTTHIFHKPKVPAVIPTNSNSNVVSGQTPKNNNGSANPSTSQNTPSPATSADELNHTLIAPTGTFVSNHFPGRNGSPTAESSSCTTSPGATCYIKFTNIDTGQITQLPSQVTDARGYTNWYWDVNKDAHLTNGRWKATAVATLGSQVKSTDDAAELVIQ